MAAEKHRETDYYYGVTRAGRLEEIAGSLKDVSERELGSTLQNLSKGWKGENALAYLNRGTKLQNRISASAEHLSEIAEDMQKAIKKFYGAEDLSR